MLTWLRHSSISYIINASHTFYLHFPLTSQFSPTCALNQWYNGPTLLQAIDNFKQPVRRTDAPLRAVITSVITENDKGP